MKLAAVAVGLLPEVERLYPEIAPMSGIDPTRGNSGIFFADADPAAYGPPSPSEAQSLVVRKAIRKRAHRSNKVFSGA